MSLASDISARAFRTRRWYVTIRIATARIGRTAGAVHPR